jgi:hypothetical protein
MTDQEPRLSTKGLKVLHAFIDAGNAELSGSEIFERTGILSGTLYPILIRFKKAGWLTDRWEDGEPVELGRPKRRYYRLTGAGQIAYRQNLPNPLMGDFAWAL